MHRRVRQHVMSTWVAMPGVLLGAMAPAVSHAMIPSGHGIAHVQVCTMSGPASLPPTAGFVLDFVSPRLAHPPLFYPAPQALFAWTAAHPRAPPRPT